MSLQVVVLELVCLIRAHQLLIKALDMQRQQPVQAKRAPFVLRERDALVSALGGSGDPCHEGHLGNLMALVAVVWSFSCSFLLVFCM